MKWWRKSAEQGDANAQCKLGFCYYHGQGVKQDYVEAVKWWRKSAEQGDAQAQFKLGFCYVKGQGVEQDDGETVKWWRKSAEQGDANAQLNLGICYRKGQGVEQNDGEAVKWWRKSAEQGDAQAQFKLGICYYHGQGVKQDYVEAVKWLRKSAEQGNKVAQQIIDEIESNIQDVSPNKSNEDFSVDNIKLDPDNKEFNYALDCVLHTNRNIYLTGKAGTGKTTFLKYLKKISTKEMVVLAPTGIAAVNAGGQTIHSFFHIPISLFIPEDKRLHKDFYNTFHYKKDTIEIIKNLDLLIIDEVSMVRCDLLDVVDIILKTIRHNASPFGGVQVLLIGDTFQLPPVVSNDEWRILRKTYNSEFFFSAKAIEGQQLLYLELKKIYRQTEQEFISLLNKIRVNQIDDADLNVLNLRHRTNFEQFDNDDYITLTTTNNSSKIVNDAKLADLPGDVIKFQAEVTGDFSQNLYPTDYELEFKVGAQVMFLKNNKKLGYNNGTVGKVAEFSDDMLTIKVSNNYGESQLIQVEKYTWQNIEYSWN